MEEHSTSMTDKDYFRAFVVNLSEWDWDINSSFKINSKTEAEAILRYLRTIDVDKVSLSER